VRVGMPLANIRDARPHTGGIHTRSSGPSSFGVQAGISLIDQFCRLVRRLHPLRLARECEDLRRDFTPPPQASKIAAGSTTP